jgi:hypothetical protein
MKNIIVIPAEKKIILKGGFILSLISLLLGLAALIIEIIDDIRH